VGDIIYADGSWSDKNNKNKTPVGVCFYISEDGKDRRMMGLSKVNGLLYSWGPTSRETDQMARLASEPSRDLSTVRGMTRDYPKWMPDDKLVLEETILDYSKGAIVPYGLYNTLCIIRQRNDILQDENYRLEVPRASDDMSETDSLKKCLAKYAGQLQQYMYYSPASLCYAYSPTVLKEETLSDKFRPHKWYLPSAAELKVILDSIAKDYSSPDNFLKVAFANGLIEQIIISGNVYQKNP
jgi:hypothetical protein